jgi:hypothetical protein
MKKIFKIFVWIIGVVLALIIFLTVVAKLSENQIADLATEKVSEAINAPIEIGNVSFNLLRKFPYATIELSGIYLGVPADSLKNDSLTYIGDTILHLGKIYLSVKTRPLIDGIIEVVKVEIEDVDMSYLVNNDSITNIDFLIPATDTNVVEELDTVPSEPLNVTLKEFTIRNINCYYNDSTLKTFASLHIPEITMEGSIKGDTINGSAIGSIEVFGVSYPETNAHLMQRTKLMFDVGYKTNGNGDSIKINNVELHTDGASLAVKGEAVMTDEIYTDLNIDIKDLNLAELIKYAPTEMLKEFGVKQVAGNLSMNADIKGIYSDSTNELPQVNAKLSMKNGLVKTADYPILKALSFEGKVSNGILQNNQTTQADFSSIHFETEQSKFDIAFSVLDIDHPKYDVKTEMTIVLDEFASFVPDSTVESVRGIINASLSTKGVLPDSIGDDFVDYVMANSKADIGLKNFNAVVDSSLSVKDFNVDMSYRPNHFKIKNLGIKIPEYGAKLRNTSLDAKIIGKLSDPDNITIDLKSYNIETDSSKIHGSLKFKNGEMPYYSTRSNVFLNLGELKSFVPDTLVEQMRGTINIGITSSATLNLDSIEVDAPDIALNKTSTYFAIKDLTVHMSNDPMTQIDNFSGKISINKNRISINDMQGTAAGIFFNIDSTYIRNVYETIIEERRDKELIVETVIDLGIIDYNKIMAMMPEDTTVVDSTQTVAKEEVAASSEAIQNDTIAVDTNALLPDFAALGVPHFLVRGRFSVEKIIYEKNILDDISANFRFADSLYVIDEFKLKTCKGEVNTSMMLDVRKWEKPKVEIKNYISGLDLNELLVVNNDFDQAEMTHENLSGILTSELHARAFYVDGDWPTERIRVKGDFTLEDGKIHDFKPLVDASVGVGGLKELDKMDFNTLTTSIFMFKDKIYVPKTDVVSNALDLSAFAMHGMTDDIGYEYHLVLHLGDVVKGKSDKLMEKQAKQNKKDGGTVDRNGLNREWENKNGFDNEKLKKKFANNLNKQEGFLNLLFNPLLVNYSTEIDRTARGREILEKYSTKE